MTPPGSVSRLIARNRSPTKTFAGSRWRAGRYRMGSPPSRLTANLSEQLEIDTAELAAQIAQGVIALGELAKQGID